MTLTPFRMNTYKKHRGEGVTSFQPKVLLSFRSASSSALGACPDRVGASLRYILHSSFIQRSTFKRANGFSSIPFLFTFFRTLLHSSKRQLFCFHAIPNSFAKTPGWGVPRSSQVGRFCYSGRPKMRASPSLLPPNATRKRKLTP